MEISDSRIKHNLTLEKAFNASFFGKDNFSEFLSFDVSKGYTKKEYKGRIIYGPSPKLRGYHKFINEFIFSYLKMKEDCVFSYRKGCSTFDAVAKHSANSRFFNTDIKNFFPSIGRNFSHEILKSNSLNIPIDDIDCFYDKILDFIIVDNCLPIGFSTSPSFSNASLFIFDNSIQDYCKKNDLVYSRYSDDIIISSNKDENIVNIYETVSNLLSNINNGKFSLNKNKTKNVRKGNKVKILGMVILPSGRITVDMKMKLKIEHLIHFYISDKEKFKDAVDNNDSDKGIEMISGMLNHINTIDKIYLNKLRKKYGNVVIDMFFHKKMN